MPWSAMQKPTVVKGCMLLCAWLPPTGDREESLIATRPSGTWYAAAPALVDSVTPAPGAGLVACVVVPLTACVWTG